MLSIKGNSQQKVDKRQDQPRAPAASKEKVVDSHRTSEGLRDILFDEIEGLRRGEGDPQRATIIAKLAGQIVAVAKLDLEYLERCRDQKNPLQPVRLGRDD